MRLTKRFLLFLFAIGLSATALHHPVIQTSPSAFAADPPANSAPAKPGPDPDKLKQALDREDIEDAVRQIELGWKQQYEAYYQAKMPSEVTDIKGIGKTLTNNAQLTGQRSALVYAIPTRTALELIVIPPDAPAIHKRIEAANQEVFAQTLETFRKGVVNPESEASDYLPAAQQLYQWMITPIEADLQAQRINNLIFCMGSRLRSAPVAALHDGNQFLAEKYSLAIIPAFNLLDPRPVSLDETRILAMGASQFKDLAPLPAVPVELSTITNTLWQGEELLNQDFTLPNLKAQRSKYPYGILHLATHAEFSPGKVEASYIQFWDQRLQLDQLNRLNLRDPAVQLLVLSACKTALGDTQAELGFAGLAVQSGSKAAMASLWSVNDAGTLVLMTEFYRHLRTAPIKSAALQQAQVALLKRKVNLTTSIAMRGSRNATIPSELVKFSQADLSHPFYWAAFTLIGNPW